MRYTIIFKILIFFSNPKISNEKKKLKKKIYYRLLRPLKIILYLKKKFHRYGFFFFNSNSTNQKPWHIDQSVGGTFVYQIFQVWLRDMLY